jgi:large subunit ribosomal protein L23
MRHPYKIIKRPVLTEKSTIQSSKNKYTFEVDRRANKIEIKEAIENFYNVRVRHVNVLNQKGKLRRIRRVPGYTASRRKAIVTLHEGERIGFFEGV